MGAAVFLVVLVAIVFRRRRRAITMQSAPPPSSFSNPMRAMLTSTRRINTMDDGYLSVLGFYEEPTSGNKRARNTHALYDVVEPRAIEPVYDEADPSGPIPDTRYGRADSVPQAVYERADSSGPIPDIRYGGADSVPLHTPQAVYERADASDPIPDTRYGRADSVPLYAPQAVYEQADASDLIPDTRADAVRVGASDLYTLPRPDRRAMARIQGDEHTLQCISGVATYEYGSAEGLYETLH